ncbi:hypothetical protein B0T18DRAFT_489531 [Schizothecium vesticola]|uniref:Uncharacterized protein n=1 Tax=Schizothecium vesticola TaxID=314040 RepID=A0AA40EX41_9PEZI|nr:hypothetical protein B0T18DRAFT_489531 [Schizothecium vesticola]
MGTFRNTYHRSPPASPSPNVTKQYAHPDQQLSTTPANLPTPTLAGNQSPDPNQDIPIKRPSQPQNKRISRVLISRDQSTELDPQAQQPPPCTSDSSPSPSHSPPPSPPSSPSPAAVTPPSPSTGPRLKNAAIPSGAGSSVCAICARTSGSWTWRIVGSRRAMWLLMMISRLSRLGNGRERTSRVRGRLLGRIRRRSGVGRGGGG